MKKRFLNLLLVMLMVVCVLPMAANAATKCWHDSKSPYCTVEKVEAKAETCAEDGYEEHFYCTFCKKVMKLEGRTYVETTKPVIPATGEHDFSDWVKKISSATCTEARVDEYKCKTCDATTTKINIHNPALDHDWVDGTVTRQPTCTVAGEKILECSRCDETKTATVAATGHNWKNKTAVDATCITDGWRGGKICRVCNEPQVASNVIPATGEHDYSEWQKRISAATCTEARVDEYKCKTCDATTTKINIHNPALGHTWDEGTVIKAATCVEEGVEEFKCTVTGCNGTKTESIAKLNCNIVDLAAKAPTCNNTGLTAGKTCTICDDTTKDQNCAYCAGIKVEQEEVDSLGHDQVLNKNHKDYVAATCDKGGVDVLDCTRCGYDGHKVNTKELGHDWDISVLKEATCTIKGMAFYQCKREGCGDWKYVNIDKLGHNKVTVPAVEPTCTATGLTAGEKCERCGHTFTAQSIVDKIAHAWKDEAAQDPTCEEAGWNAHRKCEKCGETDGKTEIPASDAYHNYVKNQCTICEEYDPAHEHQGTGTVTTEATCTTKGVKTFTCSSCENYTWTEEVAKKAHTYGEDARCTVCDKMNPKHEHSYEQTSYRAPTCTVEGKVTNVCSVCGDLSETQINATGHSYANGHCVNCGNPAACEHDNVSSTVTAATCSRNGREVFTCDDCGATVVSRSIPATGRHTYVNDHCTSCGKADPNKITVDNQGVYIVG